MLKPPSSVGGMRVSGNTSSDVESNRSMPVSLSSMQVSMKENSGPAAAATQFNFELENSQTMGIDAVKRLRQNYTINKVRISLLTLLGVQ